MASSQRSTYTLLREKWSKKHADLQKSLWDKHAQALKWVSSTFSPKQLVAGSLGGLMLLQAPTLTSLPPHTLLAKEKPSQDIDKSMFLIGDLAKVLPHEMRELTKDEELKISQILSNTYGITVTPEMEGKRLNRTYGLIGAEQHLMRYPGDTINTHFESVGEANKSADSGIAPGKGAWGYFAPSLGQLTKEDIVREKYYIAVQTFLAPDFSERVGEYRDFFKYRKMLVVNPNNGKAIIVVVGDAGPAVWTGKHLGGSPEVMDYLQRVDGSQKGPVLYFFIDDKDNKISLGPITL